MQGFSESMVQIMNFSFDRYVIGNSSSPSNISSSLLFLTLTQSRQAWTNTIFKRYSPPTPAVETDQQAKGKEAGSSGEHPPAPSTQQTNTEHVQNQTATQKTSIFDSSDGQMAQTEPQPSKPHRASTSSSKPSASPSLQSLSICKDTYKLVAENVTLIIGPHIFRDTRFYAGWKAGGKGLLVLFEFKESPETLWTFPQNASVERMNFAPPFEVLASFHLPSGVFDELAGSTKSIINPKSSSKSTGFLNMQMLNVPKELFQCIQIYTNDPLITFSEVLSKFKASSQQSQKSRLLNLPSLPFPSNIWSSVPGSVSRQPAGLSDSLFKRSSSHSFYQSTSAAATSASIASQARRKKSVHVPYTRPHTSSTASAESAHQPPSSTPSSMIKRKRIAQDELAFSATPEKLSISTHRQQSTPTSSQSSKKCAYCGTKTTPMWRRGPDGAGTLCNACGVKWKHGKIYIAPSRTSAQSKKEYLETPTSISTDNASQLESADSLLQTSADSPELSSHALKIEESPQSSNSVDEEGDVAAPLKKRRM